MAVKFRTALHSLNRLRAATPPDNERNRRLCLSRLINTALGSASIGAVETELYGFISRLRTRRWPIRPGNHTRAHRAFNAIKKNAAAWA
jgi:hypothetical protein